MKQSLDNYQSYLLNPKNDYNREIRDQYQQNAYSYGNSMKKNIYENQSQQQLSVRKKEPMQSNSSFIQNQNQERNGGLTPNSYQSQSTLIMKNSSLGTFNKKNKENFNNTNSNNFFNNSSRYGTNSKSNQENSYAIANHHNLKNQAYALNQNHSKLASQNSEKISYNQKHSGQPRQSSIQSNQSQQNNIYSNLSKLQEEKQRKSYSQNSQSSLKFNNTSSYSKPIHVNNLNNYSNNPYNTSQKQNRPQSSKPSKQSSHQSQQSQINSSANKQRSNINYEAQNSYYLDRNNKNININNNNFETISNKNEGSSKNLSVYSNYHNSSTNTYTSNFNNNKNNNNRPASSNSAKNRQSLLGNDGSETSKQKKRIFDDNSVKEVKSKQYKEEPFFTQKQLEIQERKEKKSTLFSNQPAKWNSTLPTSQSQQVFINGINSPKMQNFFQEKQQKTQGGQQKQMKNNSINYSKDETPSNRNQKMENKSQLLSNGQQPSRKQSQQSTSQQQQQQTQKQVNGNQDQKNFKDEYQEYKKLQEKLNYLESKIMSIKSNIDSNSQREKPDLKQHQPFTSKSQIPKKSSDSSQTQKFNHSMTLIKQQNLQNQQQQNQNQNQNIQQQQNQQAFPSRSGSVSTKHQYESKKPEMPQTKQPTTTTNTNPSASQSQYFHRKKEEYLKGKDTFSSQTFLKKENPYQTTQQQQKLQATTQKYDRANQSLSKNLNNNYNINNSQQFMQSSNSVSNFHSNKDSKQVRNNSNNVSKTSQNNSTYTSQGFGVKNPYNTQASLKQKQNDVDEIQDSYYSKYSNNANNSSLSYTQKYQMMNKKNYKNEQSEYKSGQYNNQQYSKPQEKNKNNDENIRPKSSQQFSKYQQQQQQQLQQQLKNNKKQQQQVQNQNEDTSSSKHHDLQEIITQVNLHQNVLAPNSQVIPTHSLQKNKHEQQSQSYQNIPKTFLQNQSQNYQNNGNAQNSDNIQPQSMKNSVVAHQQSVFTKSQQPFIYYVSSVIKSYLDIKDTSYFMNLGREHFVQTMQAISFSKMLKPPSDKLLEEKRIYLPNRSDKKKTLVFDLDETLIHCNESTNVPSDVILPIKFPNGEVIEAGINIRPYCLQILQELSKYYEIVVFTASHSCYANVVLDYLDPQQKYIQHRLFRENCVQTPEGVYIKDLRVLMNRNMADIILVDNAAYSFGYQIDNGLPILPYYDNKQDQELKHLMNFLKSIHHVRDIREVNKKLLKINSFTDYQDPVDLLQNLFQDLI